MVLLIGPVIGSAITVVLMRLIGQAIISLIEIGKILARPQPDQPDRLYWPCTKH